MKIALLNDWAIWIVDPQSLENEVIAYFLGI